MQRPLSRSDRTAYPVAAKIMANRRESRKQIRKHAERLKRTAEMYAELADLAKKTDASETFVNLVACAGSMTIAALRSAGEFMDVLCKTAEGRGPEA